MSLKELSKTQQSVFDNCMDFFMNSDRSAYVLSGVAGSGKTEIIRHLNSMLEGDMHFSFANLAFTGRAVSVVRSKLRDVGGASCQTLHSFLYIPVFGKDGVVVRWDKRDPSEIRNLYNGLIVDEASMVNENIFNDLMAIGIPILFVGDAEQLPPIDANGFNVMEHYDTHMTEIHRQAEGNPIIALSRIIRETGSINIPTGMEGICVVPKHDVTKSFIKRNSFDIALTGTNRERIKLYKLMRISKGFEADTPSIGEKIVCLKNTSVDGRGIFNGELYTIEDIAPYNGKASRFCLRGEGADSSIWVMINNKCWDENPDVYSEDIGKQGYGIFTFGDAVSVWKAQGSEFNNVLFFDEDVSYFVDRRRFRYTAVTRAKEKLTIAQ